jgi:RNA polymerase sigma-70 factor (ECF subfamily)
VALSQPEFNRLVAECGPSLYRMAYRMVGDRHDAEDLVQETYRCLWKGRWTFHPGEGERAWLVAILRRRVIDRWRRKGPVQPVSGGEFLARCVAADWEPDDGAYSDPVQQALQLLPEQLREALLLVVVGELTHQEAADVLGIPLGTVLSRVSRARKQLRKYLLTAAQNGRL